MTTEGPISHARFRSMSQVPDYRLKAELRQLNQKSHRLEAELLLYLGELDQRRLYREEACSSAFEFCVSRMGYSEEVAYKRVGAARLMRQFPRIYDLLAEGQLHLTGLMLLKPHLTEANHQDWLLAACHKSKREVERLLVSRFPKPDAKASVRKLPSASLAPDEPNPQSSAVDGEDAPIGFAEPTLAPAAAAATAAAAIAGTGSVAGTGVGTGKGTVSTMAAEPAIAFGLKTKPTAATPQVRPAPRVAPLSNSTYRVTFTASEQLKLKLDRARELLSHCIPPSDLPALIERALDQLLEREQTRRYGAIPKCKRASSRRDGPAKPPKCKRASSRRDGPAKPQPEIVEHSANHDCAPAKTETVSPHNPLDPDPTRGVEIVSTGGAVAKTDGAAGAASPRRRQPRACVRRAVFERDAGQCTFVDPQGRRCDQRHFLEFDHIEAYAIGGTETVSNLRLRCRCHNALEAEKLFGQKRVKAAIAHARQRCTR